MEGQVSAQQFRDELLRARADIELLRRALSRKQQAERLAQECREALRAAEAKMEGLRRESAEELEKRSERIGELEARLDATRKQLEEQGEAGAGKDAGKLRAELDAKVRELMDAQKNAGRLAAMLEEAVKETEALRKSREASALELAEARKSLEELTRRSGEEHEKFEEEKKKLADEKAKLDKDLAEANKKVGELTRAGENYKKDLDQAREDLNAAFALMKRDRKLKEEALAQNVAKAKELAEAQEHLAKSAETVARLDTEKQAALVEIEELKKKLAEERDDSAVRARIEKLEQQVAQAEQLSLQHAALEAEKERALRQLIDAGVMIQQLAAQRDEARAQLESAAAARQQAEDKAEDSLGAALEQALAEKQLVEEQRDALQRQVAAEKDLSAEIKASFDRAEQDLAKLKENLSAGNEEADALGAKLRGAAEALEKVRGEKREAEQRIAVLAEQLAAERLSHQAALARKEAELATLGGQLAEARELADARQQAFIDAGAHINELMVQQREEGNRRLAAERALTEASDVIVDLIAGQERLQARLNDSSRQLSQERASGETAARSLANAQRRIAEMEQDLRGVTARLSESQQALAEAGANAAKLEADKLSVEVTLQDTARLLRDVVDKQNAQQRQLGELSNSLEAEKGGRSEEQAALASARDEIGRLSAALEQQRLATRMATAELTAKIESTEMALAERTAELEALRVAFRELESRRSVAEEALEESNRVIRDLLAAKEACDARIAELSASAERQRGELDAAHAALAGERNAREVALKVKAETERRLAGVSRELDVRQQALEAAQLAASQFSSQLEALAGDRDAIAGERAALKEAFATEKGRVRELEKHVATLRGELLDKGSEVSRLDGLLASSQQSGVAAKDTLLGAATFLDTLVAKRVSEQQAAETARQELLAEMEQMRAEFTTSLTASEQAREKAIAEGQESIRSLSAAARTVKEQKEALGERVAGLQADLDAARRDKATAGQQREALARELADARAAIATLEDKAAEIERLRASAAEMESGKLQAEVALQDAATFIGELLDRRNEDAHARKSAEKALLKLRSDFEGVEKQAEELRRKLQDLEQLKIKKAEAEDRLAKMEREQPQGAVATDGVLTVVQALSGARVDAVTAQQNAENAFQAAVLELDRLRLEVARTEQEYHNLLTEKERAFEQQLGEKQQMLVIANNRLGEVDNRLQLAIEERKKAEMSAAEALVVLEQLRDEKASLDGRIRELKALVDQEKSGRTAYSSELEQLRRTLASVVVERDRVDLARQAAEKNAIAMGEILAQQSSEIESSRMLAREFQAMQTELDQVTQEREQLAKELEQAQELNPETIALKEALAEKESACSDQMEKLLGKIAERERQVAELEAVASRAGVLEAELEKLKGADHASIEDALARAAESESKARTEQQKAEQYQRALSDSEAAVQTLASKVQEVDAAHGAALERISELQSALSKARTDKAKALEAALDVKEQLLRIDPIWYALNSASVADEQARILKQAKAIRAQHPGARFEITGHTCTIGSEEGNRRLSENRARGLADYLVKNGIPRASISYKGLGPSRPIGDNATEEGRSRNRRVEVDVTVPED